MVEDAHSHAYDIPCKYHRYIFHAYLDNEPEDLPPLDMCKMGVPSRSMHLGDARGDAAISRTASGTPHIRLLGRRNQNSIVCNSNTARGSELNVSAFIFGPMATTAVEQQPTLTESRRLSGMIRKKPRATTDWVSTTVYAWMKPADLEMLASTPALKCEVESWLMDLCPAVKQFHADHGVPETASSSADRINRSSFRCSEMVFHSVSTLPTQDAMESNAGDAQECLADDHSL